MIDICIPSIKAFADLVKQVNEIKKYTKDYRLVINNEKKSAAYNRNKCIENCEGEIVIMLDDDIHGFYNGWEKDLIEPFQEGAIIVSARLIDRPGVYQNMMGWGDTLSTQGFVEIEDKRLPSACIAFKLETVKKLIADNKYPYNLPFDEYYLKAEWEDVDFSSAMSKIEPNGKMIVNNNCKLIHDNEEKWRDESIRGINREYFQRKWGITP